MIKSPPNSGGDFYVLRMGFMRFVCVILCRFNATIMIDRGAPLVLSKGGKQYGRS